MSNMFSLDSIREEAERRYSPLVIDLGGGKTVELTSILRIGEKSRKAVIGYMDELSEMEYDDEDPESVAAWSDLVVDACYKIFEIVASSPKKLASALDHPDPVIKSSLFTSVITNWMKVSQLGEADSSPS